MFFLHPGERLSFAVLAALAAVLAAYVLAGGTPVDWAAFLGGLVLYGGIMAVGLWLRLFGRLPRLSMTLIAAGFYPIFATLLALINYMQFPFAMPLIDPLLLRLDAALGYDWAAGVAWLARNPELSAVLRAVYTSSLYQLGGLLVVLGLMGRALALHRLLLTGMIAGMLTLAFWSVFPSFGPSAFVALDPEVAARAGVVVTNDYGAFLMQLAQIGPSRIEGHHILGTVAFPSFHIVMAALGFWFARGTWLLWPMAGAGALTVPATALHGGHHLVDLAGGLAVFALALAAARMLLPAQVITSGAVRPSRADSPASASAA